MEFCDNNWQGNLANIQCVSKSESIDEVRKNLSYYCCSQSQQAITPDGKKFCCGQTAGPNKNCTLNTKYGYSKKHLDNNPIPVSKSDIVSLLDKINEMNN